MVQKAGLIGGQSPKRILRRSEFDPRAVCRFFYIRPTHYCLRLTTLTFILFNPQNVMF